ncbi:hypothetical protein [Sphingomonas sp.]|uniref:hypothetical protein n=1 Tax=Sphingomonas sp. TaxID=28214 RepID=UPI002898FA6C|nr:hypothetical protein [Sphingomonas sp.]
MITPPKRPRRWIGAVMLMLLVPPVSWLSILWSNPARSGLPSPGLAYGLAALVTMPGLIGLVLLDLQGWVKALILPFYLAAMAMMLLVTLGLSACLPMGACR